MLIHAETLAAGLESEILIVGAGAVGLTLAVDLAERGKKVLVLEAGPNAISSTSQHYFENAQAIGRPMQGLHLGRFRALGGTTNFWGGQLVRFDPNVFEPRPWVRDDTAWPISRQDLDPYYDQVLKSLGMGLAMKSDEQVKNHLRISPPAFPPELSLFFTNWTPEPNLAIHFRHKIRELSNFQVVIGAPVTALNLSTDGTSVDGATVTVADNRKLCFNAKTVILANGTIEIARLLKLPSDDGRPTPWAGNTWIGRGFMDHLDFSAGQVIPADKKQFHHVFDNIMLNGLKYQPKIKLTEAAQQELRLLGVAGHFIFNSSYTEDLVNAKVFIKGLMKGRFEGDLYAIPGLIKTMIQLGIPMVLRYIKDRRIYNPADQGIQLMVVTEQKMIPESQIRLLDKTDPLGMPVVSLDWKVDGNEIDTIARFSEIVKNYLESSGLAKVTLDERLVHRDLSVASEMGDTYHQMGMARMSMDPTKGVVDSNLRVHQTRNLYVAGAAVYPSTGFPNSTFTALALGLRLSDKLVSESST